jgi:MFS family permease
MISFFIPRRYNQIMRSIPPIVLAITLITIYALTMASDITWANSGSDGGDLSSAAATNGIAHPTGYPVYLIIARVFQAIPLGSLAYRTHLLSALTMALASVLIYLIIVRELKNHFAWIAGMIGAWTFGLAPVVWSQAVITEVYGVNAFFVALIVYLSSSPKPAWLGAIFGVSLGNHVTSILLAPLMLFLPFEKSRKSSAWLVVVSFIVCCSIFYLTLPIKAFFHPPVNWGNPITLDGFLWLVSGSMYQGNWIDSPALLIDRLRALAALSLQQVGMIGLALGFGGVILSMRSKALRWSTIWIVFAYILFTLLYGTVDAHLNLIPAILCFAVWIGFGADDVIEYANRRFQFAGFALALVVTISVFYSAWLTYPVVDASRDDRAVTFGEAAMRDAPQHALIFAKGDAPIFTLWYYHFALQERPDLVIVADDLLHYAWYIDSLRNTYPDLVVGAALPFQSTIASDNPNRPACVVRAIAPLLLDCSRR